jgi:zinc D-Ala-D-Ala carboxypeptidase
MNYFKMSDFNCQQTGNNKMCPDFLAKLDNLRYECGFPFIITSGYRDPEHSIEKAKSTPGTHAQGIAADIKINSGAEGYKIVSEAIKAGFTGIGVAKTFIHLDTRKSIPVVWSY